MISHALGLPKNHKLFVRFNNHKIGILLIPLFFNICSNCLYIARVKQHRLEVYHNTRLGSTVNSHNTDLFFIKNSYLMKAINFLLEVDKEITYSFNVEIVYSYSK